MAENPQNNCILHFYIVDILLSASQDKPITITEIYNEIIARGYSYRRRTVYDIVTAFPPAQFENLILNHREVRAGDSRARGYWITFKR